MALKLNGPEQSSSSQCVEYNILTFNIFFFITFIDLSKAKDMSMNWKMGWANGNRVC